MLYVAIEPDAQDAAQKTFILSSAATAATSLSPPN